MKMSEQLSSEEEQAAAGWKAPEIGGMKTGRGQDSLEFSNPAQSTGIEQGKFYTGVTIGRDGKPDYSRALVMEDPGGKIAAGVARSEREAMPQLDPKEATENLAGCERTILSLSKTLLPSLLRDIPAENLKQYNHQEVTENDCDFYATDIEQTLEAVRNLPQNESSSKIIKSLEIMVANLRDPSITPKAKMAMADRNLFAVMYQLSHDFRIRVIDSKQREIFDKRIHQGTGVLETNNPALDGRIAKVGKPGLMMDSYLPTNANGQPLEAHNRTISAQPVEVYRFNPNMPIK